jgi:hypothetical protein
LIGRLYPTPDGFVTQEEWWRTRQGAGDYTVVEPPGSIGNP